METMQEDNEPRDYSDLAETTCLDEARKALAAGLRQGTDPS